MLGDPRVAERLGALHRISRNCSDAVLSPDAQSYSALSWHISCWTFPLHSCSSEDLHVLFPPSSLLNWSTWASRTTQFVGTLSLCFCRKHLYRKHMYLTVFTSLSVLLCSHAPSSLNSTYECHSSSVFTQPHIVPSGMSHLREKLVY